MLMLLRRRWPLAVVALMMAAYFTYFGWFTLRAYDRFVYQAYDLGIYDQAVWNSVHGRLFRSTLEEPYTSLLGDHFEPILLPIALSYLIWPSPKMLLLIQAGGLALGALPVYWLARDRLRALTKDGGLPGSAPAWLDLSALGLAGLYLLYPPVHSANVFEFHPSALATPLLLYTLLALRRRQFGRYFLFLLLVMSTKETLPLTTAALGVYVLLSERNRLVGAATIAASALWFGLVVFVVIPYFSPEGQSQYFADFYGWLGPDPGAVLTQLAAHPELVWQRLIRPDNLAYIGRLLSPLAYVPLLGLPVLLPALPALLLNVLSDFSFQHRSLTFFHYAAPIAPFVIVGAVDGTAFIGRQVGLLVARARSAVGAAERVRLAAAGVAVGAMIVAAVAAQVYHGYLPFSRDFFLVPADEKVAAAAALVQQVPLEVTAAVDRVLGPYLSQRPSLYLYPAMYDAEYVLLDASYRDTPFPPRDRFDNVQALLDQEGYGVVDGRYGYLLLKQGADSKAIPERFYDLARAGEVNPQVKTEIAFGEELRLVGFDLVWERPVRPDAHLVLYWQALRPIDRDLRLFFVQTDAQGNLLPGTELEFDSSVWYPPARWSPGATIRAETLHWSMEDPGAFGVAVGIVEGPGFWEVDKRLRPDVRVAPWPMPGVHDGALVWLATLQSDGRLATLAPPGTP